MKEEILISQRFFDPKDRYIFEDDLKKEKEIEEFIVDKVYGC